MKKEIGELEKQRSKTRRSPAGIDVTPSGGKLVSRDVRRLTVANWMKQCLVSRPFERRIDQMELKQKPQLR